MKNKLSICISVCLFFVVSGCSIRSSQLSTIIEMVKGTPDDHSDSTWIIRYGDYRTKVQALAFEGGTLFSNQQGDQVFFDGWTVTKVLGLGMMRGRWSVKDDIEGRHFTQRNRLTTYPACKPWARAELANVIQYTQACQGSGEYNNSILVTKQGAITLIRQSLNGGAGFVTLSKLQARD